MQAGPFLNGPRRSRSGLNTDDPTGEVDSARQGSAVDRS
jgi:hypothetical protein